MPQYPTPLTSTQQQQLVNTKGEPLVYSPTRSQELSLSYKGGDMGGDIGWTSYGGGGGALGGLGTQLNIGLTRFRSTSEFIGAYIADDTLHACVQLRAETLARLKWRVKHIATRQTVEGEELNPRFEDRRVARCWEALTDLLRQPNPFQTWNDFVAMQVTYFDLAGNSLFFKDNLNGLGWPEYLWPLNPALVEPVIDAELGLTEYIYQAGNQMLRASRDEVSHMLKTNPGTMFWGLSEIAALAGVLDAQVGIDEYQRAFFANGAVLSGVIKTPNAVDAKAYDRLQTEVKENFQGIRNHWRVALLTGGMEWQNVSLSQTDMGMKDWKMLGADRIRQLYRVPKSKLGSQDDAQYNKLDAADRAFYQEAITPLAEAFARKLNQDLCFQYGFQFEFDIPQYEDLNEKVSIARNLDALSCISLKEKRLSIKKLLGDKLVLEEGTSLEQLQVQGTVDFNNNFPLH